MAVPGPAEVLKEGTFANFMRHARDVRRLRER
jgi:hypothetical protein